jgi:carbon-monoxide dehydrogenase large subunit
MEPGLQEAVNFRIDALAYANACHAAEVEVDGETGEVRILRYVALQDSGTLVNPMIVDGQVHGGIAHGIGNALLEWMIYDEAGQPVTTNFAEYLLPTAPAFPKFETRYMQTPSPLNPLGAKGIGESATVGSTPAVQNAVIDALSHLGVRHIDLPCTPERVWRAVLHARAGTLPDPWHEPPAAFADLPVRERAGRDEDQIDL